MKNLLSRAGLAGLAAVCLLLVAGCAGRSPALMVQRWTLDYAPPASSGASPLPAALKIKRFAAASGFRSAEMLYRPADHRLASDPYNAWWAPPSDLIGDYLARDLAASGRFGAILAAEQQGQPRFLLEGGLLECLEENHHHGARARLVFELSLSDLSQRRLPQQVLLQKTYQVEEPLADKGAASLAAAMGRAMQRASSEAIGDLAAAVEKALAAAPEK